MSQEVPSELHVGSVLMGILSQSFTSLALPKVAKLLMMKLALAKENNAALVMSPIRMGASSWKTMAIAQMVNIPDFQGLTSAILLKQRTVCWQTPQTQRSAINVKMDIFWMKKIIPVSISKAVNKRTIIWDVWNARMGTSQMAVENAKILWKSAANTDILEKIRLEMINMNASNAKKDIN